MSGISLQRNNRVSLARQVYQAFKQQMVDGVLRPGEPLPSTRELARQLGIARNTACEAYEMLCAEGFIESRQGAPTRVAQGVGLDRVLPVIEKQECGSRVNEWQVDFRTGQPDLRHFPRQAWLQLLRKASEEVPLKYWGYAGPEGLPALRKEIALWLFRSRGMVVDAGDIFITAGATQALYLLSDLLFRPGQTMIVEDPGHRGMLSVLQNRNRKISPVPVDEQGLQTSLIKGQEAYAVYITPSHQFPLGGILPAGRRAALIRLARENEQYIIEDDYDSEFRYIGPPVAPLFSMDAQRVIYVGTFSKILFPALRIGYVVLPRTLQEQWRELRTHADVQNPLFEQVVLCEFLRARKLDRHVRNMRKLYAQRRNALLAGLNRIFSNTWRPWGDAAGLHIALEFPVRRFGQDFIRYAREKGVNITNVDYHSINKGVHLDKLLMGYGHLDPQEIASGLELLKELF